MSELVPVDGSTVSPVQRMQLGRAQRRAEVDVVRHGLRRWVDVERDRIDTHASDSAVRCAFEAEVALFDYGIVRAEGSETKQQLLARKLGLLASINDTRIIRRFGR